MVKLGYIDYLNCYPFYYHMFEIEKPEGVTVFPGYPSRLNQMTASGELHMSPVSAATCAEIADDVYVLPDVCLSSVGYVKSVVLVSKYPITRLDGKRIGLTGASHTSVVLLKILIETYFSLKPIYTDTGPMPSLDELDGALLIGNEAMIYHPEPQYYVYDLGELWLEKTGFPVVFALFVVRKDALDDRLKKISEVIFSYRRSLRCLYDKNPDLIAKATLKYPDIPYGVEDYFNLFEFEFTDQLKKALFFYYEQADRIGLLKAVTTLSYLDI